ncbi:ATP-binding protein [Microbacterium sp. CJ88]|uniref:ATP-binding protein n=1 Tax=Microbacterium sp. CJ88 TaxID=3445672 RepID=UPI003F65D029
MTDFTLTADKARPLIPDTHWRIERIQVVNWGGFHQKTTTFEFHHDATIVTGASGVGKSTILDAYLALMMPSDVAFNGASNAAAGGRVRGSDQRSLRTYLKGKTDDTVEEGMTVDKSLRGQGKPTWGAIAATFVADTGNRFTVVRAYFVPAAAARDGDVVKRMMTTPGTFNVGDLYEFARVGSESYPARALKARWPDLRIYGSYDEFSQSLFSRLGIGQSGDGAKALDLLARIQAGTMSRTVDDLYKKLVIEVPETFKVADEAIATFDELDEMYRKMEVSQQQADLLEPIVDLHAQMVAAQQDIAQARALGAIDSNDTPAGLWRLRTHVRILDAEADQLREQMVTTDEQLRTAKTVALAQEEALDSAKAEYAAGGGDRDKQLTVEIAAHEAEAEGRRRTRVRLEEPLLVLDRTIDSEPDFMRLQADARAFPSLAQEQEKELAETRDRMLGEEVPLGDAKVRIRGELRSLDGRTSRVDKSMIERRLLVSEASGIPVSDLPYVAELIDLADGEEGWRHAVETILSASARRMLIPAELQDHFSQAIEPLHLSPRLYFEGVVRGNSARTTLLDPEKVAGKLVFKDSPYQGWVIDHISDPSRNALCVPSPGQLRGDGLRVTPSGQTRRGTHGAHGVNSSRPVIGFDNADIRQQFEQDAREIDDALAASMQARAGIEKKLSDLRARGIAYEKTLFFGWTDVDVQTPVTLAARLRKQQADLLAADGALATLKKQVDEMTHAVGLAQRHQHKLEEAREGIGIAYENNADIVDEVKTILWALEDDSSVALDDSLIAKLDGAWVRVLAGEQATSQTWKVSLKRLGEHLGDEVARASSAEQSAVQQLERTFQNFQNQWYDPTRGTSLASYREYLAILEDITRVGIHEQRELWRRSALQWSGKSLRLLGSAMSSAVDDIGARLDSVNAILERLSFGPTDGRLKIEMRRLAPQTVTTFRRELESFRKLATKSTSDEELVLRFAQMREFIARIRKRDDPVLSPAQRETVAREEILDVRRHVEITARELTRDGEPAAEYSSLAGKSGGEMQELVAFIVGAALRFQLGDELGALPRFAPVFLDEGFIKADSEYAGRAVEAWKGLGFQLIVGAPLDKYTGLERHVAQTIVISKNRETGHSFVDHVHHVRTA